MSLDTTAAGTDFVQKPPCALEVSDLRVSLKTKDGPLPIVRGLSFDLAAGEIVALVGESGSGKSVTALSVARLMDNAVSASVSGRVLLDGRDLLSLSDAEMRLLRGNGIAMIFQEPMTSLNPILTIGLQVSEGLQRFRGISRREAWALGAELLESVGITEPAARMNVYPHQLSGGMRQRVMIAIALSGNPKVLIADEPTTALDVTTQAQILDMVTERAAELGTAMLLITHDLGLVARYAARVNVMYSGVVVEQARADTIFREPCHPYTRGLLASVPRLDQARGGRLPAIEGLPPTLGQLPAGCAFRMRCSYAAPGCEREQKLRESQSGSRVACWRAEDLPAYRGQG